MDIPVSPGTTGDIQTAGFKAKQIQYTFGYTVTSIKYNILLIKNLSMHIYVIIIGIM